MLPLGQLLGEGFVVGLAGGTGCLATCGPVLLPYLLVEEGRSRWQSVLALGQLLLGRLVGYLAFGLVAWLVGRARHPAAGTDPLIAGAPQVTHGSAPA